MEVADFIGEGAQEQDETVAPPNSEDPQGQTDEEGTPDLPENTTDSGVETMAPPVSEKSARGQRLLIARHKRRALGQEAANEELESDIAALKAFYALPEDEQEAYLTCYELKKDEHTALKDGLSRATTCGIRLFAARALPTRSYSHVVNALDKAEVRDGIRQLWEEFDIKPYADARLVKIVAAVGAIADSVVKTSLQVISTAASAEMPSGPGYGVPQGPAPVFTTRDLRPNVPAGQSAPAASHAAPASGNVPSAVPAGANSGVASAIQPPSAPVLVETLPQ